MEVEVVMPSALSSKLCFNRQANSWAARVSFALAVLRLIVG